MNTNNIFVNIGLHKCGSTFLQAEVLPKLKNLKPFTFFDNDVLLNEFNYISQCGEIYYENKVESLISNYFNKKNDYFISSEGLSGMGYGSYNNGALIKVIANRIKNIFPNAKIMIIIRSQKTALESHYKDDVKYGYLNDYKSWFFWKRNNCGLDYFKYSKLIEVYQEIFGKNNVKVFLYEKLFNLDYLNKNFKEFGIDPSGLENIDLKKKYNESFSAISLKITRVINRFFGSKLTHGVTFGKDPKLKVYNFWRYKLSNYFNKINFQNSFEFDEYENLLKNSFHDDNKRLSKLIEVNLDKYNYI